MLLFPALLIICFLDSIKQQAEKPLKQKIVACSFSDRLKPFKWIIGTWKMPVKDGYLFEAWRILDDSTFKSQGFKIKNNGDTVFLESVELGYRKKNYYYTSTVSDQNNMKPVPFIIISINKRSFIAENPAHDFPQRISYELKNKNHLYAFIDGKVKEKYIKNEFSYQKVK